MTEEKVRTILCKLKIVEVIIYITLLILVCVSVIVKWRLGFYLAAGGIFFTTMIDLIVENITFKEFFFGNDERNE